LNARRARGDKQDGTNGTNGDAGGTSPCARRRRARQSAVRLHAGAMRTFAKVAIGILAAFGLLQVAGLLLVATQGATGRGPACTVYPVMDIPSPAGSARATVENRRCGERELQTDVSVSAKGRAAGWSQTVFSAHAANVRAGSYSPLQLRVTWLDESHLEIRYPRGVKPDTRERSAGVVHIDYIEAEVFPP
jgi:hypothetical protein